MFGFAYVQKPECPQNTDTVECANDCVLTEQHHQIVDVPDQRVQRLRRHILDDVLLVAGRLVLHQPLEHILLLGQFTLEQDGNLPPIVHQRGQTAQIVLVGQRGIVDLHETDAQLIGLVIDVLQLLQCLGAALAFRLVWSLVVCVCMCGDECVGMCVLYGTGFGVGF